jgi:hypothetical protein
VFAPPPDLTTTARSSRTDSLRSSRGAHQPSTSGYRARSTSPLPDPPPRDRPRRRSRDRERTSLRSELYGRVDGSRNRDQELPGPPDDRSRKRRRGSRSWDLGGGELAEGPQHDWDSMDSQMRRQARPPREPGVSRRSSVPASSNTVLVRVCFLLVWWRLAILHSGCDLELTTFSRFVVKMI